MWLMHCPNLSKLLPLGVYFFESCIQKIGLSFYVNMGRNFQKSAFLTLSNFARVWASHTKPHVTSIAETQTDKCRIVKILTYYKMSNCQMSELVSLLHPKQTVLFGPLRNCRGRNQDAVVFAAIFVFTYLS